MISYFQKNKIKTIFILLLFSMNVLFLASFWFPRIFRPPHDGERLRNFIVQELQLDEEQTVAFDELKNEHRREIRSARDQIKSSREAFYRLLLQDDYSENEYRENLELVQNAQRQIEMINFKHFQKIRKLCREEQKERFDQIIDEMAKMISVSNPPPPL